MPASSMNQPLGGLKGVVKGVIKDGKRGKNEETSREKELQEEVENQKAQIHSLEQKLAVFVDERASQTGKRQKEKARGRSKERGRRSTEEEAPGSLRELMQRRARSGSPGPSIEILVPKHQPAPAKPIVDVESIKANLEMISGMERHLAGLRQASKLRQGITEGLQQELESVQVDPRALNLTPSSLETSPDPT